MQAYKTEKIIKENGKLILNGIPFSVNEHVEIIILRKPKKPNQKFPLKGKLRKYESPFEPIPIENWEILK